MNVPVDTRPMNVPVDTRPMNVPVPTRPMNVPVSGVSPSWRVFSNQLFTEQLAISVAGAFGATAAGL